jgi:hypothetical protein
MLFSFLKASLVEKCVDLNASLAVKINFARSKPYKTNSYGKPKGLV